MVQPARRRHGAGVIAIIRDGYGAAAAWTGPGRLPKPTGT
jgi:hypothetical protein